MRLTFLGTAASYPDAGRACAGYLLQAGDTSVLFDCGNGVLGNLGQVMDPTRLDAVFVTHAHVDHFADVYALQAALRYAPAGPLPPLPLYVPDGLFERMGSVLTEHGAYELTEAFQPHELADGVPVRIGPITVTPHIVPHIDPTFALCADAGGGRLCYTSDTAPGISAHEAIRGTKVLLADATLPILYEDRAPHMTPAQAATLARDAGAETLVLTHLWPTVDRDGAAADAAAIFGGRVIVAEELGSIDID